MRLTLLGTAPAVAVAAAVQAESHGGHGLLLGVGPFLVVWLHKPFDAMAVGTLLARGGHSRALSHLVNGCLAMAVREPVGVILGIAPWTRSSSRSR